MNSSFESLPVRTDSTLLAELRNEEKITHVQIYATKPALVKVNNTVRGIVVKGIDDKESSYDDVNERRELEKMARKLLG